MFFYSVVACLSYFLIDVEKPSRYCCLYLYLLQIQIVNVLWKTAHFPKASSDFSKAHGILTWILQVTERR